MFSEPVYSDSLVTLYHGDCREIEEWLGADILVTDPPYGRNWKQGRQPSRMRRLGWADDSHPGITGDEDTSTRDAVLGLWGDRKAIIFGDLLLPPPPHTRQVLIYRKSLTSGSKGTFLGFRRDVEAVYLAGPWTAGLHGRSSILASLKDGNSAQKESGHPHGKPLDVMTELISRCPDGVIADPFCGSGSTLIAARSLGRHAIGVEIDETYVRRAVERLNEPSLFREELPWNPGYSASNSPRASS
jgi:DNA modification methylase